MGVRGWASLCRLRPSRHTNPVPIGRLRPSQAASYGAVVGLCWLLPVDMPSVSAAGAPPLGHERSSPPVLDGIRAWAAQPSPAPLFQPSVTAVTEN